MRLKRVKIIVESRGYCRTSSLVSLSSSFGFFGRLMPSIVDND